MKDGYKVELQTPETMKLFGSRKLNRQNNDLSSFSPMQL